MDLIHWLEKSSPELVFISVVAPSTLIHARYLCTKLHAEFPHLSIIVGLWGQSGLLPEILESLKTSGATDVITSFSEAIGKARNHGSPHLSLQATSEA